MKKEGRVVGIDFGLKRLGLSVSDRTKLIATPLQTLLAERKLEKTVDKLLAFLTEYEKKSSDPIEAIVVGMPLLMSGKKGFIADEVEHFIAVLKEKTSIPIIPWDERLTSVQAERSLKEGDLSRKKRAQVVDSVAALILLQNYLDAKRIHSLES